MEISNVKILWKYAKSRWYFHFKLQQGNEETRVIFLCPGKLEKIKQKERNRLPAYVTNVGMPMVKKIEWTRCLEYLQRRIFSLALKTMKMTGRKTSLREHPFFFLLLSFFANETRAEKQVPLHAKEKHKWLDSATCLWAGHNSILSPIFSDFKSDLSRVALFLTTGQGEWRLLVWGC